MCAAFLGASLSVYYTQYSGYFDVVCFKAQSADTFCMVIVTVSSLSLPLFLQLCRRHDDHLSV